MVERYFAPSMRFILKQQANNMQRKLFSISGQVQGVGFRPFVFRLAVRHALSGTVKNGPEGVSVEVQGEAGAVDAFYAALLAELPPLARISAISQRELPPVEGEEAFCIIASSGGLAHEVLISPDVATCPDCLDDMRQSGGRRYRYPFTNCTNCGPRYTITRAMPYDRAQTSMSCFPLCPECAKEYEDPYDRRFHAQPNACPVCGPRVWIPAGDGARIEGDAAIKELAQRLRNGAIAAVKGLGGFHLVCNAADDAAVERLRRAKQRPHKPLAVMVADIDMARRFARVREDEERLLTSLERPIVLCPAAASGLSGLVSPDTGYVGVMLPYTPLHHVLLEYAEASLVMTSGNRGGEPIALGNREALARLAGIADVFLLHNRDILVRTDDSVLRPMPGAMLQKGDAPVMHMRRARGFVPSPLALAEGFEKCGSILALGAGLKNTVCLTRGREAFVSQHIGDLQNIETSAFQAEIARHLAAVLQVEPRGAVLDAHPDFAGQSFCSSSAGGCPGGNIKCGSPSGAGVSEPDFTALPRKTLQHHFAHAEAVLGENMERGPALVLALDGTGYAPPELNPDKSIWGGELIFAHPAENTLERVGSLSLMPLPGGEAAIRQPWRIAHGWLHQMGLSEHCDIQTADSDEMLRQRGGRRKPSSGAGAGKALSALKREPQREIVPANGAKLPWLPEHAVAAGVIGQMVERRLNTPFSSGAGRLFDAVSALLGLCLETNYEGQAAIRLEEAQFGGTPPDDWRSLYVNAPVLDCPVLPNPREGLELGLDTRALFRAIYDALLNGAGVAGLARSFHASLAEGLANMALAASDMRGTKLVGLSGGVMQNMSLVLLLKEKLRERGLTPLTHRRLPPGDGCISFGQAVWGVRNF